MRALIADELASMRHFLAMCLAEFPELAVDQAASAARTLELANERPYSLVILDRALDTEDLSIVHSLRRRHPQAPTLTLVLVERDYDATAKRLKTLGASVLLKPVRAIQVRQLVSRVLGIEITAVGLSAAALPDRLTVQFGDRPPRRLEVQELGALGCFCVTDELEGVGRVGDVTLTLPTLTSPLVVAGRVVHIRTEPLDEERARGFALRFEPNSPEQSAVLASAFVARPDSDHARAVRQLSRIPIFKTLSPAELSEVGDIVQETTVGKDAVVLREGDPSDAFFIVKFGAVKIVKGEPPQELAVLREGDFFGEMGVLLGAPRSATVIAMLPTALYRIEEAGLLGLMRRNATISQKIQATMIERYAENVAAVFAKRLPR